MLTTPPKFIDYALVEKLAQDGCTMLEIAEACGVSKVTFFKRKSKDDLLRAVYNRGVRAFTERTGKKFIREGRVSARFDGTGLLSDEKRKLRAVAKRQPEAALLAYIGRCPGAQFDGIRRALRVTEDGLCDLLADVILKGLFQETNKVIPMRGSDGAFRYFLRSQVHGMELAAA